MPSTWASQKTGLGIPEGCRSHPFDNASAFFARIQQDGTLRRLLDRYYGHVDRLNRIDVVAFLEQTNPQRLPDYAETFTQAQEITGIDWRLMAAIGYQESHWDPFATSPTGVRGVMMLTGETADRMGVSDRLDPTSEHPGRRPLSADLKESLPARIPGARPHLAGAGRLQPGQGHMEDARRIAQARDGNPDSGPM